MSQIGNEVDLNNLPDKEYAKEMLWIDVVRDLKKLINEHPIAMMSLFAFYRRYYIVGHPKLGRFFMRLGRYITLGNYKEINSIINEKGDVIHEQR